MANYREHKHERGSEVKDRKEKVGENKQGLAELAARVKGEIARKAADAIRQAHSMFGKLDQRAAKKGQQPSTQAAIVNTEINYVDAIRELQVNTVTAADFAKLGPESAETKEHLPSNFEDRFKWLLRHSNGNEYTYDAWVGELERFAPLSAEERERKAAMTPELQQFIQWPQETIRLLLNAIKYEVRPRFDDLGGKIPEEEIDAKVIQITSVRGLPNIYDHERYSIGGDKPARFDDQFPGWGRKDFARLCEKIEEHRRRAIEEANRRYQERKKNEEENS